MLFNSHVFMQRISAKEAPVLNSVQFTEFSTTHRQNSGKVLTIFMRVYFLIQNRPKLWNSLTKTHDLFFLM